MTKYWDLISPFSLTLRDTLFIWVSSTHIYTQTLCAETHISLQTYRTVNGSKWLENSPEPFSSHFLNGSPDRMSRDAPVDRPKIGTGRFLLIMRDRQPAGFCLFFGRFFRKCHLCGRHSAGAQQTQKNRYNEANCRWCNITGTQIRAAFICCSSWSC